ncbi:DUF6445 family protein [Bradyrhizobium sp. vgs-9]|uniref:DUF6445 family protein n=1 Tax=Bradyrhizobium sp. vgs-9 TaxID=208389 RepID=UPI0035D4512B
MKSKLIVVDDFYAHPERIRDRALSSAYANIEATDYPGYASKMRLDATQLRQRFGELIGADLNVDNARFTWGNFRFITAETGARAKVHADVAVDWAGMVYLTPDALPGAGTGFFRHKATGFEGPPSNRQARALGFANAQEFDDQVIRRDKGDLDKWECTMAIEPRYNRLILFRGSEFYHAPLGGMGHDPETARLTHIFFFNEYPRAAVVLGEVGADAQSA